MYKEGSHMAKPSLSAESEKSYRAIFECAGAAMAVIGKDMTLVFVNRAFLVLFERTREMVEGKRWTDFAPEANIIGKLRDADPGAPPVECDLSWASRNGRKKHILAIVSSIPEKRGYVASFFDVTRLIHAEDALWESEDKFRAIFEGSAIAMSLVDPLEGRILVSNQAMQNMLGYSAKELAGMQFATFTHPEDMESQWTLYRDMVAGRTKHFTMTKRYLRKDGTIIRARLIASLALRTSGKPAVVVNMVEEMDGPRSG
jgi:PAS domain S-box-containing protein